MLTTRQAAAELGVSDRYVRSVIAAGTLEAIDIGTGGARPTFRISHEALAAFVGELSDRTAERRIETRG